MSTNSETSDHKGEYFKERVSKVEKELDAAIQVLLHRDIISRAFDIKHGVCPSDIIVKALENLLNKYKSE